MTRSAIFIDVGYLFAAAGKLVCGTRNRASLVCDTSRLTTDLADFVDKHSRGMDSLRTYWYDGAPNGVPTPAHKTIGGLAYVKVRLGRVIQGEQKGVDALIYRDLMTLARERAISRAYLLSGDEDLREGVVAAQDMGVQVILLGVPGSTTNQSETLIRESDEHCVLPRSHWERYFSRRKTKKLAGSSSPEYARDIGRGFGRAWMSTLSPVELQTARVARPRIRRDVDASLLLHGEELLGSLHEQQNLKHALRAGFWEIIDSPGPTGNLNDQDADDEVKVTRKTGNNPASIKS